jgi:hypothetical protein
MSFEHRSPETPQVPGIPALMPDQNSWSLADISGLINRCALGSGVGSPEIVVVDDYWNKIVLRWQVMTRDLDDSDLLVHLLLGAYRT